MSYIYETEEGLLGIRQNCYGTWDLYLDDLRLGNYATPDATAQDVALCVTGCWAWDQQLSVDELADLSAWRENSAENRDAPAQR